MYKIAGHHHISMITKNGNKNNHFYRHILGLRRVKMTVNQDSPSMYHLFYGDRTGTPGTELSFFEIPAVGATHRGTNAITGIGLVVPTIESLHFYKERFEHFDVKHEAISTYAGRPALRFEDHEGLRMILQVNDTVAPQWDLWEDGEIPTAHQIRGMGSVEITIKNSDKFEKTLTKLFPYTKISETGDEKIFQSVEGEIFGEIVVKQLDGEREKPGRGSIHHLAIRVKNDTELSYWNDKVQEHGFTTSGIVDRYYFKSLYFRESNGILFEIATDGPGFTIDGNIDSLGEQLDLPPFLEARRAEITAQLTPIED